VGAERPLWRTGLTHISRWTGQGDIFQHTGAQLGQPFIEGALNLRSGGLRVLEAPFLNGDDNLFTQDAPMRDTLERSWGHGRFLSLGISFPLYYIIIRFPYPPPSQNFDAHPFRAA
jgi:hypothetical protein